MKNKRFPLGLFSYGVLLVSWILPISLTIYLMHNASGNLNFERDWVRLVIIFSFIFSPCVPATWSFIVEKTTWYSSVGISRLTVFGKQMFEWQRIDEIEKGLFALVIRLQKKKYYIRLLMYKNPQDVIDYVEKQYQHGIYS